MKTLLKLAIPLVVVFAITQCDSVEPKVEETETEQIELLSPVNSSTDQPINVDLEWKQIKGAKVYELMVSETENFESAAIDTVIETDSFDNGNVSVSFKTPSLKRETTYYWKVFPIKPNQAGPWSEVWNFTTRESEAEPGAVDLMSPESGITLDAGEITFEWISMEDAESYTYQVAADADFTELIVDTLVTESTISLDDLEPGNEYSWRVAPELESETGPWSEAWSFLIDGSGDGSDDGSNDDTEDPVNPKVTLVSPESGDSDLSTEVVFNWEEESGFTEYDYQLSNDETFESVIIEETVSGTSYTAEELSNDENYFWRVKVAGSGDEWSDVWGFSTENALPDAVTLTSPSDFSIDVSTELEFSWEELTGYGEYQYQLSDDNSFSNIIVEETVSGTSYTPQELDYGKEYYWRVKIAGEYDNWSDGWSFTTEEEPTAPPASGEFVTAQNSNFMLNNEVFRFAGTNAYYLPNYEKINTGVVDRALNLFEDSGVNVVRMWAFYDGYDCGYSRNDSNENVIQTSPGVYSESALRDLDNVIAKGKERGIKFILPFINFWDQLGGVCQYNTWAGASNPSRNMEFFISNSQTQKWYKDYIDMLLNRVNTVTGVAYKDEPAIFSWQIVAEGRNKGADPKILRDWYQEIAQYIKSIDTNHMVATGEEGFDNGTPSEYSSSQYNSNYVLNANEGTSYTMNIAIPEIDYGNSHWYPEDWGMGSGLNLTTQEAWIKDHKNIAESHGKPFVLGEYGHLGWGDSSVLEGYEALWNLAEEIQLDGSTLWQLVADGTKCYEFGGNICYPGGRADTNLYNSFKIHIENMSNNK